MRAFLRGSALALVPTCVLLAACSVTSTNGVFSAPDGPTGVTSGPGDAPTGQRWEGVQSDKGCGRSGIEYVLVDEVCGREGKGYADLSLRAPMFRDGALVGDRLLAVDATFMWSLDVTDPTRRIERSSLLGGLGQPIALAKYGTSLLVAAGEEGLLTVDASDPAHPTKASGLGLSGHALDVDVQDDVAYVALGKGGLGVVDLTTSPPTLLNTIAVPGYATGVKVRGRRAYVAACTTMAVVDLDARAVVGRTWTPSAVQNGVLTAPAKDVELVGNVAFVAAGRQGTVAIDVSDASRPAVLGNCSRTEPSFYASGVRAEGEKLFVAAGEWGVLPLDVSAPATTCRQSVAPPVKTKPPGEPTCTAEAPWEVLPWESLWAPPPPAKDPIQVLPAGGRVFAFGDARRIGTRAVDVRDTSTMALPLVGRYDEPRKLVGIAASGGRLAAAGVGGGLFRIDTDGGLERSPTDQDAWFRSALGVSFLADGRWVAFGPTEIYAEGRRDSIALTLVKDAHAIVALQGSEVAVIGKSGAEIVDVVTKTSRPLQLPKSALPAAIATDGTSLFLAGPESVASTRTSLFGGLPVKLAPHGVFDEEDAADLGKWQTRLPRRKLVMANGKLVEVATLGDRAGLVVHGTAARVTLPPATYDGIAASGDSIFLTSLDRSLYRSTMVTVSLAGGRAEVVSTEVFTGGAAGVATVPGHAYVADADGTLRIYSTSGRSPSLVGTVSVEAPR